MSGMKYKDIAEKYGTTINTVKSWKKRYGWNREEGAHKSKKVCTQKGKGAPKVVAPIDDGTKETLRNDELTPEQQMFCIYYSRTFNATQSYLNVYGCSYETAMVEGSKSLRKPKVRAEIERLKEIKRQQIVAGTDDIVELQMRIAFADIGNYMSFGQKEIEDPETGIKYMVSAVDLKESKDTDTQLLQEVKRGKDGVSIKLADRQKAIDWLTMFFEMNPTDKHRKEFDKRKLDLELLKLEMQTRDSAEDAPEQDNFLDALNGSAKEAWSDD
uniref:Terminase small subunit n=1 Tax=Myoviridae sp. ctvns3 TaxID=2825204 RepID=A0A8S5PC75_9CAUD|nr:MAG TPA: Terminase small subunit [Myoviridae sp. ctvns3]